MYFNALNDLGTERQMGMQAGPIPWSKIRDYAEFLGVSEGNLRPFIYVVRELDNAWLKHMADQAERENKRKASKSNKAPSSNSKTRNSSWRSSA